MKKLLIETESKYYTMIDIYCIMYMENKEWKTKNVTYMKYDDAIKHAEYLLNKKKYKHVIVTTQTLMLDMDKTYTNA